MAGLRHSRLLFWLDSVPTFITIWHCQLRPKAFLHKIYEYIKVLKRETLTPPAAIRKRKSSHRVNLLKYTISNHQLTWN